MSVRREDLRYGSVLHHFLRFLFPSITGMAIKAVYILSDTIFIGRSAGQSGLAAINIIIPYFAIMYAIAMMIGIGGASLMAIYYGQKKYAQGEVIFRQAVMATGVIMLAVTLLTLINLDSLCRLLGASEQLLPLCRDYLGILTLFSAPYALGWAISGFVRNDGDPDRVMYAMVTGALMNIVLDWLFLFYFQWGMKGAALATGLSQLIMLGILLTHFLLPQNTLHFNVQKPDFSIWLRVFRNGLPTFMMETSTGAMVFVANLVMFGLGGELFVSAYAIAINTNWLVVLLIYGITQAIQPLISFFHGSRQYGRICSALHLGAGVTVTVCGIVSAIVLLFSAPIAAVFVISPSESLIKTGSLALIMYAVVFIPMGINLVTQTLYQSVAMAKASTWISVLRSLVIPVAGMTLLPVVFGKESVWWTPLFAEGITLILSLSLLSRYMRFLHETESQNQGESLKV
ncbi:Multidrug export protein MepA [invertebrate metagenome]|uniref:Multidrug export protein MepA n=1 Tax=invertebrate metagenome TaxID=1711999 RepID=A0A2H9T3G7_9ZZZZ